MSRNIFQIDWHHREPLPKAATPCPVHCIRRYGHGVGMSLFGLGAPNNPSVHLCLRNLVL